MRQKLFAVGIGLALTSLAAVGAFASQDAVELQEEPTVEATATELAATETPVNGTATPEATGTPEDATATPEATGTPGEGTATPEATATGEPAATETPDDGEDEDAHGIPDSNPSKHPEDGDGVCEKGETVVKTTPSGNRVNVPCHAAQNSGQGDDDEDEEEESETESQDAGKNRGHGRR